MVSSRWEEIKLVFEMAASEEEQRWRPFLAEACGDDARLAEEVLELLIADREAKTFLEDPVFDPAGTFDVQSDDAFEPHDVLCGRFEIVALLGEGGMGQVYEALDLNLQETVAIKTIRRDLVDMPGTLDRFKRELFATRKVTHINVCRTFDLESHTTFHDDEPHTVTFLTMELLRGETLAAHLREKGPLNAGEARLLAKQLAHALNAAHQVGIVHCDLKPANIFLTHTDFGPRAVVTDFGIARLVQQTQNEASHAEVFPRSPWLSAMAGTPRYMAPEQAECGVCTARSDLYSFGLVLLEALTGELPSSVEDIPGDRLSKLLACVASPDGTQEAIDPMWEVLLSGCLRRDPEERFSQVSQVLEILEEQPAGAASSAKWLDWRNSRTWLVLSSLFVLIVGAIWIGHTLKLEASEPAREASVAVLSFAGNPGDPALQELSSKVAVDLTRELAQVSGLRVPSHSLVLSSDRAENFNAVGRRLNTDTLLNGSLESQPDGLVEKVELIDTHTGAQLWSRTYKRPKDEAESLQKDIAEEVAFRLRTRLNSGASHAMVAHAMSPAAKAAYDRGRSEVAEHTPAGWAKAVTDFQQAIDADPQSAAAYADLASTYILMAHNYNRPEAPFALMANAETAARRALQLDSASAQAYCALAQIELLRDYNWSAAEENFKRAAEIDPAYLPAHTSYAALLLTGQGRFAEARAQFAYADRSPDRKLSTELSEINAAYYARQFESSAQMAEGVLKRFPGNEVAAQILALDDIAKGASEAVGALFRSRPPATGDEEISRQFILAIVYAQQGQKAKAVELLRQMEKAPQHGLEPNMQLASVAAAVGDSRKALRYLERSYEQRQTSLLYIGVDPLMDPLRGDPGFRELLNKMNLN